MLRMADHLDRQQVQESSTSEPRGNNGRHCAAPGGTIHGTGESQSGLSVLPCNGCMALLAHILAAERMYSACRSWQGLPNISNGPSNAAC